MSTETTTTTRAKGAQQLDRTAELNILALGELAHTPLRRAQLHGLSLHAYLKRVYGYEPGPLAGGQETRAPLTLRAALARRRAQS